MTRKAFCNLGLFLATMAALALGLGHPQVTFAGETDALAPETLTETVERLSPEQRRALVDAAVVASPRARLAVKMANQGYTTDEIRDRLALLSEKEIETLAGEPEAMEAGGSVGTVVFVFSLALVAAIVAWYFMFQEPVEVEPPPPPAE
ncbi:MAG: PA2779 family protein [Planctomycetota bacterium]